MKRLLLLTIGLFVGCSPVEIDYGGSGDFIVHNKSNKLIRVEITKVSQLGGDLDTSELIESDSSRIVLSDAIIGSNVTPQRSISSMKIFEDSIGSMILLYTQDPIDESKWLIQKQYSGDFGYTRNVFNFNDSMITR